MQKSRFGEEKVIGLLKLVVQGEADVRAGRTVAAGEVFAALRPRIETGPA